jgi:hypothetical protein
LLSLKSLNHRKCKINFLKYTSLAKDDSTKTDTIENTFILILKENEGLGMWLSGTAFAYHVQGPEFSPSTTRKK